MSSVEDTVVTRDLAARLVQLASVPRVLVACDYDGTLAPIVEDPEQARPDLLALTSLRRLAGLPGVGAAIVSGRALGSLRGFVGRDFPGHLVGSHGAEWDTPGVALTVEQQATHRTLARTVGSLTQDVPGLRCEVKPGSIAMHYRKVPPRLAEAAVAAAVRAFGDLPHVAVRRGHMVVEFMVVRASKGEAVRRLRVALGVSAVLFIGDDLTDEDVFTTLGDGDVPVRVGPGTTAARYRVGGVREVADLLRRFGDSRVPSGTEAGK